MTYGERLYLLLVLATFISFSVGVGRISWRQTRLDTARAARRDETASEMHPAE